MKRTMRTLVPVAMVSGLVAGLALAGGAPVWVAAAVVVVFWIV